MSARPFIQCPKCSSRSDEGAEFEVVQPYKAASTGEFAGFDEYGRMLIGMGDPGNPTHFGQPELVCDSCGHQWATSREVSDRRP